MFRLFRFAAAGLCGAASLTARSFAMARRDGSGGGGRKPPDPLFSSWASFVPQGSGTFLHSLIVLHSWSQLTRVQPIRLPVVRSRGRAAIGGHNSSPADLSP